MDIPAGSATELRNLVFAGCGVRNAAYAGGLMELERQGRLDAVRCYAGTSAGSIVATLCAVGYTPEEVLQEILELEFPRLLDGNFLTGLIGLWRRYGWHSARYLEAQLDRLIERRLGKKQASFADLESASDRRLFIVATDLSRSRARIFPDERTRDLPLNRAVRASMSIPLLFQAVQLEGTHYVDGGVMLNMPLGLFDRAGMDPRATLGFSIRSADAEVREDVHGFRSYVHALFGSISASQLEGERARPLDLERWIRISDLGIRSTQFAITEAQKLALAEAGRMATREFFEVRGA